MVGIYRSDLSEEELIARFSNLVFKIAQRIHRQLKSNVFLEDLIAYGYTGLLEAHKRFDDDYSVMFATYAFYRIRGEILDACRRAGWGLKARRQAAAIQEQLDINEHLESEQLANAPRPEAKTYHDCVNYLTDIVSDTAVIVMMRRLQREQAHEGAPQARRMQRRQAASRLYRYIEMLDDNEQDVLHSYYFKDICMEEIAQQMGFSKSWVCRIHARAIQKLQKAMEAEREAF